MSVDRLKLITQPAIHELSVANIERPHATQFYTASFNMLVGLESDDMPYFSIDQLHPIRLPIYKNGLQKVEHITLPSDKAKRLITLIKKMNSLRHGLDCHDFVLLSQGWGRDGDIDVDNEVFTKNDSIESGMPYQVLVRTGSDTERECMFTHSAIGTDEGRLLSVTGLDLPLGTMDIKTTLEVHARGLSPQLTSLKLL